MRANRSGRLSWAVLLSLALAVLTPWAWADTTPPAPPESPPPPALGRAWPVETRPAVLRGWEPPATLYGRGHRGVDLAAPPGSPVRAVAPGRVSFAGRVAGRGVVSVGLTGTDIRTTYEPVKASVKKGDEVEAGEVVGTVEPGVAHCTATCIHWGLLRGSTYLNPLSLLPPALLRRTPPRLLPVLGVPLPRALSRRTIQPRRHRLSLVTPSSIHRAGALPAAAARVGAAGRRGHERGQPAGDRMRTCHGESAADAP